MPIQLTERFKEDYFMPRSDARYRLSRIQSFMAKRLHEELRRFIANYREDTFYIDIGLITPKDWESYIREGRVFPEKSEHFFSIPHLLDKRRNITMYGDYWTESVGGISFYTNDEARTFEIFRDLSKKVMKGEVRLGHVYFLSGLRDGGKKAVIDVSNRKDEVYNMRLSNLLHIVPRFAVSYNKGLTLHKYIVK